MGRLLFLSHSGADSFAAKALKTRIEASPDAQRAGVTVWLDLDELVAGRSWQDQIEEALARADAFCVYVGANGVVNWVDREVKEGLNRATGDGAIPFIPIRASATLSWSKMPTFARQHQGVTDPLGDEQQLGRLIAGVLEAPKPIPILTDEPFVGLRAMGEAEADRFFGREEETAELVAKLRARPLVAVVADSGAGKSSLARAGLIPKWRGGAVSRRERPGASVKHVVEMRPGARPLDGLRDGIERAAGAMGRTLEERHMLRKAVRLDDPADVSFALRCGLPPGEETETLLIVDQFEELLTLAKQPDARAFADCLVAMVERDDQIRIVLTIRADYFNLLSQHEALYAALTAASKETQLRLKSISPASLAEIVKRPLRMAGHGDAAEQEELLRRIAYDTPERAGDLALVQMALTATWRRSRSAGVDLLRAYSDVDGVLGALAHEAERAVKEELNEEERDLLLPLFARLVRLGDTGGATRRRAALADLDPRIAALARKLAGEDCGRLLQTDETTAEIAHEALISQWSWLQNQVQGHAAEVRSLARLGDQTDRWRTEAGAASLGAGDLRAFSALAAKRGDWLIAPERELLRRAWWRSRAANAAATFAVAAIVAVASIASFLFVRATEAERIAEDNLSRAYLALAETARRDQRIDDARKLILAAWPSSAADQKQKFPEAILELTRLPTARLEGHGEAVNSVAFSPDGSYLAVGSGDRSARIWDLSSGAEIGRLEGQGNWVNSVAFSPDGARLATGSDDDTAQIWDLASGAEVLRLEGHGEDVTSVVFSPDGALLATGSYDASARIWDLASGTEIVRLEGHAEDVTSVVFSPDGALLATGSYDASTRIWDVASGAEIVRLEGHGAPVYSVAFSPDGARLATGSDDDTARIWDVESGMEIARLEGHANMVESVAFSPDGKRLATGSFDDTVRIWDVASKTEIFRLESHGRTVPSVAFSPNGARLASGSRDGTARIISVRFARPAEFFQIQCDLLQEHDLSTLLDRYGVLIEDPICGDGYAPPPPEGVDPDAPFDPFSLIIR